ncbi:MAG: hypothetical protein HY700_03030 [Gemmatimonadetes bacterium]|nr:hypothetical protein [Gemmatimonadota bacterium]
MSEARRWLNSRLPEAPPSLRRRIEQALDLHQVPPDHSVADALRAVAAAMLEEAKTGGPARDAALTLLAADALVTYACEVTAETDPARLAELR